MKKRFLSWSCALGLIVSCAGMATACGGGGSGHKHAYDQGVCSECGAVEGLQFEYRSSTQTYAVLDGHAVTLSALTIPATYNDGKHGEKPVTVIGGGAFTAHETLESVTLPSSVTVIEGHAFSMCPALSLVELGGVEEIGTTAFSECPSLYTLSIPASVNVIGDNAFNGCVNLNTVNISEGVEVIAGWAFRGCEQLSQINIPSTVETIGQYTFCACTSLTSLTIPKSVTVIGFLAFAECGLQHIYYQGTQAEWQAIEKGAYGKVHPDYDDDIALPSQTTIHYNN